MEDEFDLDDLGAERDAPTVESLLALIREGAYDVPALARTLGLSEDHVRLILSMLAKEDPISPNGLSSG